VRWRRVHEGERRSLGRGKTARSQAGGPTRRTNTEARAHASHEFVTETVFLQTDQPALTGEGLFFPDRVSHQIADREDADHPHVVHTERR